MQKLTLVVNNISDRPDPEPPTGGAAAIQPVTFTKSESKEGGWPRILGVLAPPEDDISSYADYRKDRVWQALEKIVNKRGIDLMVEDFKKYKDKVLGLCLKGHSTIFINEHVPNWYKPRVLAHELAHYQLHGDMDTAAYSNDPTYYSAIEMEADHFANRLLRWVKHRLSRDAEEVKREIREQVEKRRADALERMEKALKRSLYLSEHPEDAKDLEERKMVGIIQDVQWAIIETIRKQKEAQEVG